MRRFNAAVVLLVAGIVVAASFLCSVARAQDEPKEPLHPFWTGPVYGVFTDAGPDSVGGPRVKLHVPIGVVLTKPFSAFGFNLTPETMFKWTTKAYLGEDSDPLQDAAYQWIPYVRITPENVGDTGLQWIKVGAPDHLSNGYSGADTRSLNAVSAEAAYALQLAGINITLYGKVWGVYDYGENTQSIQDAINFGGTLDDVGAQLIVRGSVDMLEMATEFGPEWQKIMAYIPLHDFYTFGAYLELHHGKLEGLLDYGTDVTTVSGGVAFRPQ